MGDDEGDDDVAGGVDVGDGGGALDALGGEALSDQPPLRNATVSTPVRRAASMSYGVSPIMTACEASTPSCFSANTFAR